MDFPFDIYDVAEKIGLLLKRQHNKSADYNCPFCDGIGKLNLNIERNAYRCNKCGAYGGMLDLFCKCTNVPDRKTAYRYLAVSNSDDFSIQKREQRQVAVSMIKEVQKADIDRLDFCYRAMLDELEFFTDVNGEIRVNIHNHMSGFFVPVFNEKRQIQGMQIRLDTMDTKRKYMWFSSAEKTNGCSSKSPVQISGDVFGSNAIYVTEGALKGQIAHFLSGKPFVATAGVNQQKELEILFQRLKRESQCKMIIDAFDMDDDTNEHVRRGHQNLAWLADKYGFIPKRIVWDRQYKGIDDYLLSRKNNGGI